MLTRSKPLTRTAPLRRGRKGLRGWWQKPEAGTRARTIRELDIAVSKIVRRRDKACVCCGKTNGLQAGHFYSRRWLHVRFDLRNVHAQCSDCNKRHNVNQWPYLSALLRIHGPDVLSELHRLRMQTRKVTDAELEELLDEYQQQLRRAA